MINTITLPPFKKMCVTIGNLPSSFVESMSYYEALCWMYNYLDKTVIPAINTEGEAITELQAAFVTLKTYVDNYFENLDVQEEINNKLDTMAESGELTDIIAQYLGLAGLLVFDSVADLAAAENLVNGSSVKTMGFYAAGDGGGSFYKIRTVTNEDVVDGITIVALTNNVSLVAELLLNDIMYVKQFGAVGDNDTDDTDKFNLALSKVKTLIINNSTYALDYLAIPDNKIILGEDSIINTAISSTHLNAIGNNCKVERLTINSTNDDREWNRIDMTDKQNIILEQCVFSGFRQQTIVSPATDYNVWALYFRNSKNISVKNCKFDNNNFEDIIVEYNCQNLSFENLTSTNGINVDIEPSQNYDLFNITFTNCYINLLHTTDYYYTGNNTHNITFTDCIIKDFAYRGANVTFINCDIYDFKSLNISNVLFSGSVNLINSASFGKNLFDDKYFDSMSYNTNNSYWKLSYASTGWSGMVSRVSDNDGEFTVLNPDNLGQNIYLDAPIQTVDPTKCYALRTILKSKNVTGSINSSTCVLLTFYNEENTQLAQYTCSLNRYPMDGTLSPVADELLFIKPPTGAATLKIQYRNGQGGAKQSIYLKAAGFYEIKRKEYANANNIESIPDRKHREFYNAIVPTSAFVPYSVGDKFYFTSPSTYIGAVCTVAGQPGTWKQFGSLES